MCTAADYSKYTGWAIGANWTWGTEAADGDKTGICFANDKNCVTIETDTTDNFIKAFTSADAIAAAEPNTADGGYCTMNDFGGFSSKCWFGNLEAKALKSQTAYRFQNLDDTVREIGDVENVWVTPGTGGSANLATSVTYANAA